MPLGGPSPGGVEPFDLPLQYLFVTGPGQSLPQNQARRIPNTPDLGYTDACPR
jgi:hypothetical protein